MKVVLDTNVLLISLPNFSKYRPIFDGLITGKISLAISNEILHEYEEVIGKKTTPEIAQNLVELLLKLDSVEKVEIHYRWNLIKLDIDDNKFVDCAISARVKYIVSNDHHFSVLKNIKFPPIEIVNADHFLSEILELK